MTISAGRRRRSVEAIVFDVLMVAVVGIILIDALGLRPGARFVPLVVGIPTLIAMLVLLARDLRGTPAEELAPAPDAIPVYDPVSGEHNLPDLAHADLGQLIRAAEAEERSDEVIPDSPEARRRQVLLAVWAIGVFAIAFVFDFLVAVPIGLFTIFLVTRQSLILNLVITGTVTAFVFVLFKQVLEVRF